MPMGIFMGWITLEYYYPTMKTYTLNLEMRKKGLDFDFTSLNIRNDFKKKCGSSSAFKHGANLTAS